jgi:hypothetical protein
MYAKQFLHEKLSGVMHLKRLATLESLLTGLLKDKKLSVTQLGRSLESSAQEKNNIKRSDRFISNHHVWKERFSIYREISLSLVGNNRRPLIIVDWSHVPNTTCYILRAAFVGSGRALTLYEEVFPKRLENSPEVHQRFLNKLRKLLPETCIPVVITDAGFATPWFRSVQEMGWDYVGRIRGNKCFRVEGEEQWRYYSDCCSGLARQTPVCLGRAALNKKLAFKTHLYLTKIPKKYRVSLNKLKKKAHYKKDIEHGNAANEPWLLATSMKRMPDTIVKLYFSRMEIEEGFRDLKSSQFGFSFENAYSLKIRRIQILLMIAMLAAYILFFVGLAAEIKQLHHQFQANTTINRRVLSLFYLGGRVIKKKIRIGSSFIYKAFLQLQQSTPWNWEEKL